MKNWFRYWWESKKCNLPLFWNQQLISEAATGTHRQGKPRKTQSRGLFRENCSLLSQQKCNTIWDKWTCANILILQYKIWVYWILRIFEFCSKVLTEEQVGEPHQSSKSECRNYGGQRVFWRRGPKPIRFDDRDVRAWLKEEKAKAKEGHEASVQLLGEGELNEEITLAFFKQFKVFSDLEKRLKISPLSPGKVAV